MQSAVAEVPIVYTEPSEAVNKRLKRDWDAARASRANLHSLTIYVWLRAGFFFVFFCTNNKAIKPVVQSHNEGVFGHREDHNKRWLTGVQAASLRRWLRGEFGPGCERLNRLGDAAAAGNLPANRQRC